MAHSVTFTVSTKPDVPPTEVHKWLMDIILKGLSTDTSGLGNVGVPNVRCDEYIEPVAVEETEKVSDTVSLTKRNGIITGITIINQGSLS